MILKAFHYLINYFINIIVIIHSLIIGKKVIVLKNLNFFVQKIALNQKLNI